MRFDKADWDVMNGAERFPDGSEPLVCYGIRVDDLETVAVIDGNGFYLGIVTPDGDTISTIESDADNAAAIFHFIATLRDGYDTGELIDMGLEPRRLA
jgi:hypothetical protein